MIRRHIFLLFIVLSAAGSALAFLPPDASVREPEIRARREKVRREYEERMEERREAQVRAYYRTKAAINIPPWDRKRILDGASDEEIKQMAEQKIVAKKTVKKRVLVSIVLFIIIGCAIGWVKHATREVDL